MSVRIWCLLGALLVTLSGCGASDTTTQAKAFELEGAWLYLGPSDGPHTLTVDRSAMVYADVEGHWSSTWTLKTYDNASHHFQVAFSSGSGSYLPVGTSMSGVYDVSGTLLTVQLGKDSASYPELQSPGTCTGTANGTPVPECRLYIKK